MTLAAVLLTLVYITVLVITFMKGKYVFGVLGIFFGIFCLIGAVRLAKPNSWWARNRYDNVKMGESRERYPEKAARPSRI